MNPMEIAKLLMGAGGGDPTALSMLDASNAPVPDDPAFKEFMNPSASNAGMALLGAGDGASFPTSMGYNAQPVPTIGGTDMPMPPGMTGAGPGAPPRAVNPPGAPEPAPAPASPPQAAGPPGGGGGLGERLAGIGQGMMQPPKPVFSGGVSGTPKGLADTVHKPGNTPSPAMLLMQALLGGGKKMPGMG